MHVLIWHADDIGNKYGGDVETSLKMAHLVAYHQGTLFYVCSQMFSSTLCFNAKTQFLYTCKFYSANLYKQ